VGGWREFIATCNHNLILTTLECEKRGLDTSTEASPALHVSVSGAKHDEQSSGPAKSAPGSHFSCARSPLSHRLMRRSVPPAKIIHHRSVLLLCSTLSACFPFINSILRAIKHPVVTLTTFLATTQTTALSCLHNDLLFHISPTSSGASTFFPISYPREQPHGKMSAMATSLCSSTFFFSFIISHIFPFLSSFELHLVRLI
jgi:hypothetical protein